MTEIKPDLDSSHPIMDPITDALEHLESRRSMRIATIAGALATSADVVYVATSNANIANADGLAGTSGILLAALTANFAYFWRTAPHE